MSAADELRDTVLRVLTGQSPDYFIFPNASAFVAEGLDAVDVADELDELHRAGTVEREIFFVAVEGGADDGATVEMPGGYRLKREEGGDMRETTPEPEPTPGEPTPGEPDPDGDDDD
jgi:hypothetical protein